VTVVQVRGLTVGLPRPVVGVMAETVVPGLCQAECPSKLVPSVISASTRSSSIERRREPAVFRARRAHARSRGPRGWARRRTTAARVD